MKKFVIYGHYIEDKLFYIGSNWFSGDENRPYDFKYRVPHWFEFIFKNRYTVNDVQVKILEEIFDDVDNHSKKTLKRENELIAKNKSSVINKIFSETVLSNNREIAKHIGKQAAITRRNTVCENGLTIDENNGLKISKNKMETVNGVTKAKIAYEKSRKKRSEIQSNGLTGYQNHAIKSGITAKTKIDENTGLTVAKLRAKKAAKTASKRTYTKVCVECGKTFNGNYRCKYCSTECRGLHYLKNKKR